MASRFNPIELELFNNRLIAVVEEMGAVLGQAGFSPNIKERRDFSCALFDADGDMVCHAAHIPVHVGSSPLSVRAAIDAHDLKRGDVVMLNDPYAGGTHLPDLTLVAPVFSGRSARPYAYVADRAHHADIGGATPGSMPLSSDVHEEGFRIPPVLLRRRGKIVRDTLALFLANTRVETERRGDLDAQLGALEAGGSRLLELVARHGAGRLTDAMAALQRYSTRLIQQVVEEIPKGRWQAEDLLDDDGMGGDPVPIRVTVERRGRSLRIDFTGSAPQVAGPLNANLAVTTSAVFYVVALIAGEEVPANSGMMKPIEIRTTRGSVVDCAFPAPVAGGNVETSQRIVDVLLRAFARAMPGRIPAASAGSMTNVALGGHDGSRGRGFSYYETVGGGAGAGPSGHGASALQTHMTNTLNTPIEALEAYYPIKVLRYAVRRGSGGRGEHRGGDGIDREIELLVPARLTLLAERRTQRPYGLAGGEPGKAGADWATRAGKKRRLPSKVSLTLGAGDRLRVQTPGGGGYGKKR